MTNKRPKCQCGNLRKKGIKSKTTGDQLYSSYCSPCLRKMHKQGVYGKNGGVARVLTRNITREFKKRHCECCGFIPVHTCQLDVDHIDGNHKNNEASNLKTLCANCHRLKTLINKDWLDKKIPSKKEG